MAEQKAIIEYRTKRGLGKDQVYFFENLSMLIESGVGVAESLETIAKASDKKRTQKILLEIQRKVEEGVPLWRSMAESRVFPMHIVSLIGLGEKSGNLSKNLKLVAEQAEKQRLFKSRIMSASMYPVIVMVLAIVIGLVISWFLLPRLSTVFNQLGVELPLTTRVLISLGDFLRDYGLYVVPGTIMALITMILILFVFKKTRSIGQRLVFRLPIIGRLVKENEVASFGYLYGSLLKAGLNPAQALQAMSNGAEYPQYKKLYGQLYALIQDGNSFQKSFKKVDLRHKLVPSFVQQMIFTGEKSGNLPETFGRIGAIYEQKSETTAKNLSVLLEPVLLVIIWLMVMFIALAVIVPIYSLIGGFNAR